MRKIKGIPIREPENFIVEEVVSRKFLRRFSHSRAGKVEGPYTLCILKKRMLTTHEALKIVAEKFSVPVSRIGYAGLKDKFGITSQYITIKNFAGNGFHLENISLSIIGKTDKHISVGDLLGNKFVTTLHEWNRNLGKNIRKFPSSGFPNYFGSQRFGAHNNNHKVGRMILKRNFSAALKMMNRMYGTNFPDIRNFGRKRIKFLINAYQSWIFNCALKECVRKGLRPKAIKMPGFNTKLGRGKEDIIVASILEKENLRPSDFAFPELSMTCSGSSRSAFVKAKVAAEKINGALRLSFFLPKGCYATMLVAEAMKK